MADQKLDTLLNLSLEASEEERARSLNLNEGFDEETGLWDIIVKYSGSLEESKGMGAKIIPLLGGYAIVTLPKNQIETFAALPQVEYVEMPKRLFFTLFDAAQASCVRSVQIGREGLSGKGVLVGIVDSGIDYRHPDFRKEDGTTRILKLWDQTQKFNNSDREETGSEETLNQRSEERVYTMEEINEALQLDPEEGYRIVSERDLSGHGTAVAGIAAGNGRASNGEYRGVAYESDLLVVKLGTPKENSFPRTVELMRGIDVLVREAIRLQRPIAINLSFGNNYGSHKGDSLLETYLNEVANIGRNVIVVGAGNNGADNLHTNGKIRTDEQQEIEFGISAYEPVLNLQLWKNYADKIDVYLESPSGDRIGPLSDQTGAQRYRTGTTELLLYYGKPSPYQLSQEIYIDFLPINRYIDSGIWKLILRGSQIKEGTYSLWLPGGGVLNPATGFFLSTPDGTLTIPGSASKVLTVGAYNSYSNTYADFSGRGSTNFSYPKPDLAAPGVNITAPKTNGTYASFTGTSFATPFVTGAAALLMEWGIVQGNDPYLYGEKVKAYLQRGTKAVAGFQEYPNYEVGYGTLCVGESFEM